MKAKTIILTAVASLTIATTTFAGLSVAEMARKTENSIAIVRECLAAGMVCDPSDNSMASPNAVGISIKQIDEAATGKTRWTYLNPGLETWVLWDKAGVLHYFQADLERYNPSTREYDIRLEGHWVNANAPGVYKIGN